VAAVNTRTRSDVESIPSAEAPVDHLYLALASGRAGHGARYSLRDLDRVEIGRGAELTAARRGSALQLAVPDPWMSTHHLRFERDLAHWTAVDAGSRNGIRVNGARQERAIVQDRDVIEAGRSFFFLRCAELMDAPSPARPGEPSLLRTLDPALARTFEELGRIAASRISVLIGGATGTGKERVARAVHQGSRRSGAYVAVNCGALPAGLVESELFGHKKGAFSGAIADSPGLVISSSGGTLFLDEIGDLPLPAQATLLRVLEEREVRSVGAAVAVSVDLRVVAATHRDLDAMVEAGTFRADLVARLSGFRIELPPLCERTVDLGIILAEVAPEPTLSAAAARALFAYAWPHNIRELVRVTERAAALAAGAELQTNHLPEEIAAAKFTAAPPLPPDARREELVALLEKHKGNISKVADLGRVRQQVQRWIKRYAIDAERYR
jgi:DNA-binding NtrC family response regulator